MEKKFKPMLAVNADRDKIKYPCLYSNKLDGIRCIFKDGKMLARSLKPITSDTLQDRFQNLKDLTADGNLILDGELYSHGMPFTEISHFVRKSDADVPKSVRFNCFDIISNDNYDTEYCDRRILFDIISDEDNVVILKQKELNNEEELDKAFEKVLKDGYEGLILRSANGPYKCGRSTANEGYLLKIKPFLSFDAKIIDVIERMENLNESQKNELGRSFKRNTKEDKKGTGIAAVFKVMYKGVEGGVTITGDEDFRKEIWDNRESYIDRMIEYKAMVVGMKDFPRHANFMRFREDRD
jgi:DNA ligase-1